MKFTISLAIAALVSYLSSTAEADLYWDANGAAAGGSNSTTAAGTWGVDNFWSTSSAGTAATAGWTAGENAVFSAGTNVTGAYTVMLDGTQSASGIRFEEGDVTLSGGTELTLSGGGVNADYNGNGIVDAADYVLWRKNDINGPTGYTDWRAAFGGPAGGSPTINVAAANATIDSVVAGAVRLVKTGAGTLRLNGANTYSGGTTISGGKLSIPNDAALGAVPASAIVDHVQISGGGILSNTFAGVADFVVQNRGITFGAGAGTLDVPDTMGDMDIFGTVAGADKWTKTGPGILYLRNGANTFTGGFKVTGGILVHSALETRAPVAGTLRASGAEPATLVPDYAILDGGTMLYNNTGVGSTFLSSNKGITLGANGGGLMLNGNVSPAGNTSISIYFGTVSAAAGTTPTLYKRGHGEIRGDKFTTTEDEGWHQTRLVVEEGLFRVGHFAEEAILGEVPATYLADAVRLAGRGLTRVDGAAAIGLTSSATQGANFHHEVTTTPATRGIFVEANGGTIVTSLGTGSWVIESIISGPGAVNINGNGFVVTAAGEFGTATSTLVFKGANTYAGATNVNSGTLVVDGATAKLGGGDVTVDGVTIGIDGAAAPAAGKLKIMSGVADAIANTATLSLSGGGTAGVADLGYLDLGAGINEIVNKLVLGGTAQAAGTYGATGSGATNIMDEYFLGSGILTVSSSGIGSGVVPEPAVGILFMAGTMLLSGSRAGRRRGGCW